MNMEFRSPMDAQNVQGSYDQLFVEKESNENVKSWKPMLSMLSRYYFC